MKKNDKNRILRMLSDIVLFLLIIGNIYIAIKNGSVASIVLISIYSILGIIYVLIDFKRYLKEERNEDDK